jgi:hypothetical protein
MKRILLLTTMLLMVLGVFAQSSSEYVDLGLPSGTKWKKSNEKGFYYSWDEAMSLFGNKMPTHEQIVELQAFCTWEWTGKGYKVIGDNGNYINLQASGRRDRNGGGLEDVGSIGYYWSSTPNGEGNAYSNCFGARKVGIGKYGRGYGFTVRLVQD